MTGSKFVSQGATKECGICLNQNLQLRPSVVTLVKIASLLPFIPQFLVCLQQAMDGRFRYMMKLAHRLDHLPMPEIIGNFFAKSRDKNLAAAFDWDSCLFSLCCQRTSVVLANCLN